MRDEKPAKTSAKLTAGRQKRRSDNSCAAGRGGALVEVYARAGTPWAR